MKTKRTKSYTVRGKIWLYSGESSNWHFITIPKKESEDIKNTYGSLAKGWGSLPVSVKTGSTTWTTSIFPDSKSKTYILPLKAQIRRKEGLYDGDNLSISFTLDA